MVLKIVRVDITKIEGFDLNNILLSEKSYEKILMYDVLYKTLIGAKPLRIIVDKVNGFIRDFDRMKYLVLFSPEICDAIYRIRYIVGLKRSTTYNDFHNYAKIKLVPMMICLKKHQLCIMLPYLFSKIFIKITTGVTA